MSVTAQPQSDSEPPGHISAPRAAAARRRALVEALAASVVVTGAVTAVSAWAPVSYVGTAVGFIFLAATWVLVWRRDDERVLRYGLALGGLVMPNRLDFPRLARHAGVALAWALGFAAITFVPFFFGWQAWWAPKSGFTLSLSWDTLSESVAQLVVVALPEEAFYRGYLQSRLDDAWAPRLRVLGATVGPGLLVASIVFALGHLATIRSAPRLAVFFPSLLFGWLRARTGGIGAGVAFHALCNIFSELLGRGYGAY